RSAGWYGSGRARSSCGATPGPSGSASVRGRACGERARSSGCARSAPACASRSSAARAAGRASSSCSHRGAPDMQRGGTILVIEDEEDIAAIVRAYLERDGFRVVWAARGTEGLSALERHDVRLAILDLQLPDADGFDVCRAIRSCSRLPVVMLTARDEEVDRVTGLELGADDYVTKPFSPRELAARVRAVLRRVEPDATDDRLAVGDGELDRRARTATVAGDEVELTGREFELLWHLAARPGIVVTRTQLLDRVWGLAFPGGTRTVDVHVWQIRRKLGRPALIRTVRGAGYKV